MAPKYCPYNKAEFAAFTATLTKESFKPHCLCYMCDAPCKTPHGFMTHAVKHGADVTDFGALKTLRHAMNEQSKALPAAGDTCVADVEFKYLKPHPNGDVTQVGCVCGKFLHKQGLKTHLQNSKQHKDNKVDSTILTQFKAFKDGRKLEKKGVDIT